jgi:AcrR family transcriptional regulator
VAAAAKQFHARGYNRVSLDGIASAVTISAPALYRHFGGKSALLQAVIDDSLRAIETVVAASNSSAALARSLAALTVANDHFGVILNREVDCLDAGHRDRVDARYTQIVASVAALIEAERSDLAPKIAEMVARAALAIPLAAANNPAAAGTEMLRRLTESGVRYVCRRLDFDSSEFVPSTRRVPPGVRAQPWLSRPEAILAAAPWLLTRRRGTETTTLEDLGAAVGISGTGVYTYFSSKADVFYAVAVRSLRWATVDIERALAMSTSGPDAMLRGLESVVQLADWFSGSLLEPAAPNLSTEQRATITRMTDEYMSLWLQCVRAARNDLSIMEQGIMLTLCAGIAYELAIRPAVSTMRPTDATVARVSLEILLEVSPAS